MNGRRSQTDSLSDERFFRELDEAAASLLLVGFDYPSNSVLLMFMLNLFDDNESI